MTLEPGGRRERERERERKRKKEREREREIERESANMAIFFQQATLQLTAVANFTLLSFDLNMNQYFCIRLPNGIT